MISLDLARRIRAAGIPWVPAAGDRFFVPDRDMDDEVFVVSDMVVQVHDLPVGRLLGFNATTEWALDSILAHEVVWLPREEQLRELLGEAFVSLLATPGGFVVVVDRNGVEERHIDIDAECALARAVLDVRAASQDQ
jgi:hypothetical protein